MVAIEYADGRRDVYTEAWVEWGNPIGITAIKGYTQHPDGRITDRFDNSGLREALYFGGSDE